MLTYEDADYFTLELLETRSREEALAFQRKVGLGALLYETKEPIDMFLYFYTLMDYQGNNLKEFYNPEWFLVTVVVETLLPADEEGLVCVCWKIDPRNISREFSVVVKGDQLYKAAILLRLQQIGVL